MAVKNFDFSKNWVGSKVASMNKTFFAFLAQFGHTFWPQQAQIWDSLNRILVFNPLERHKLYYYQLCYYYIITNCFLLFLTQYWGQQFSPNFLQMWYLLLFWPQFPLRYFYNHYFLLLNVFLMQNLKKAYW